MLEIDVESWPIVPSEQRPKKFYTSQNLNIEEIANLSEKGWQVVDVRLMPETDDRERQEGVRAWLWGLTNGTIPNTKAILDVLDLRAKACGLVGNKEAALEKPKMEKAELDGLLDVGVNRLRDLATPKKGKKK
jgi:hypothetical protein